MQIDYTIKKVSHNIKPCPKCGRNGEYRRLQGNNKKGDYILETYIHKGSYEFGGAMRLVDESCSIVTPSNNTCTRLGGTVAKNDSGEQPPSG